MKNSMVVIMVYNFEDAVKQLKVIKDPITITNPPGSVKYLGVRSIDYLFKILQARFSNISQVVFNIEDDIPALFTLLRLGYSRSEIIYTGNSTSAKKLLQL